MPGPADLARAARRAAGRAGVRQQLRVDLAAPGPGHLRSGRCWWSRLSYFPFVYLPVAAAYRGSGSRARGDRPGPGSLAPGRCSSGCSCRSCGWPCSAAACWWPCTCWPSSARCRCCATRRSPRRSTTSTARPSTAPARPCWPASWSCCAWCCCSPSCGCAAGGATPAPDGEPPGRCAGCSSAALTVPALAGLTALVALAAGRPARQPRPCGWCAAPPSGSTGRRWATTTASTLVLAAVTAAVVVGDGAAHRLAGRPRARPDLDPARAQHLPGQRGSGHRRRARARHPQHPVHPAPVPDGAGADGRLRR